MKNRLESLPDTHTDFVFKVQPDSFGIWSLIAMSIVLLSFIAYRQYYRRKKGK
jgi:cell division protein FtsW (lipid II flippase)